jgi:hypothetical protein
MQTCGLLGCLRLPTCTSSGYGAYVRLLQIMTDVTLVTDVSGPHLAATPPLCSSGATGILVVAVSSLFRFNRLMNGSVALGYALRRVGVVGPTRAKVTRWPHKSSGKEPVDTAPDGPEWAERAFALLSVLWSGVLLVVFVFPG